MGNSAERSGHSNNINNQDLENVPEWRFPGFEDEWEEKCLKDVCVINPKTEVPNEFNYIDLESVNSGILSQTEKINKKDAPSRAQRKLDKKDILFATVRPYQQNNYYFNLDGTYVSSTGYAQIRAKENSKYLYYFLHTNQFLNEVMKRCTGTSYPAINANDLKTIKIKIPSLKEQETIASLFSYIDQKIEFMETKRSYLKKLKTYFLQYMFCNNKNIPKLRFKEYSDYWTDFYLGDIVTFKDNKRKPINNTEREKLEKIYPYYGAAGIIDYVDDYLFDDILLLLGEDGTIVPNLVSGKFWVSNHAHVLKNNDNVNITFLFYVLSKINYEKYNTGTIQPKLNKETAKKIKIKLPKLEEQNKISNLIGVIDEKIICIDKEIQLDKKFKSSLLSKLFC